MSAEGGTGSLPAVASSRHAEGGEPRYGALPWIVLAAAAGVAVTSAADALARTGHAGGSVLFWLATGLILVPAALRLLGGEASSGERAATVVVVGLALYAIKVLRDPFGFTYADELVHLHNVQAILGSGSLFGGNSILPITARYPGLESSAAAIVRAGGVSPFTAGVTLIALARAVMMLALYLFYERVSGSPKGAGLGALVYTATPTYLFFSAQFSYESLALPLASVAVLAMIRWGQATDPLDRRRWATLVAVIAAAIVVTHHVTSYAFVAFVLAVCLLHWRLHGKRGAPWGMAASIAALATGWLVFAASGTIGYLSPVLTIALNKVVQTISGQASTRVLFANQGGVESTPTDERLLALVGILVLGAGIYAGIRVVWRQRQRNPPVVILVLAAVAYVATLPLRLVSAAWETASRAGDFLFIGVGLTVALGVVWLLDNDVRGRRLHPRVAAAAVVLVFASGVIAGWPASLRLALPRRVVAGGHTIEPPGYVAARWSGTMLGSTQRVAAQDSDARLFIDYGHQTAFSGTNPNVDLVLSSTAPLQPWERTVLQRSRITLVETDRRAISSDIIAGYFFDVGPTPLIPAASANKFNLPDVDRLYDSGNVVIYGVSKLW